MAEISKITLPSGNTYDIKDATAREMISGGVSFVIAWDGASVPTVANIPAGVVVKYNGTNYTGTLDADDAEVGAFYLVKSSTTPSAETLDVYDEYVPVGVTGSKTWEKIGDTQLNLSDVVTDVSLSKQTDVVLGEATTFTGVDPTITVTPSTTYLGATASGTAVGADGTAAAITGFGTHTTDTFVKSVTAETNKNLVTTTVPNVTNAGTASTWDFTMGSGANAETLIISGANSTAPTLGTAKTVATGETSTSGTGDAVVTGVTVGDSAQAITALGTPTTANALTGVKVTAQPTVSLGSNSSSATGRVQVATGITSASASGTGVTVGTNDKVTVLKNTTDVSVTKGNA
jgi:hypothetical protein